MIVNDTILVEIKAGTALSVGAKPQLINYVRIAKLEVGLLLFFGPTPEFHRIVGSRASVP
jgi:GxxExxY protein